MFYRMLCANVVIEFKGLYHSIRLLVFHICKIIADVFIIYNFLLFCVINNKINFKKTTGLFCSGPG